MPKRVRLIPGINVFDRGFMRHSYMAMGRLESLIDMNIRWLRQCEELLKGLPNGMLAAIPPGLDPHRAGGHIRHIVEFYECFLNGISSCHIDYDSRAHNREMEQSPSVALTRLSAVTERLSQLRLEDVVLMVRMEDADAQGVISAWMPSSVSRELQVLSSHTIHHFAMVSMTLRALGHTVDPLFGVAPSTLRFAAKARPAA
jgi:uncharacterized damage-inducible protein DinB